VYEKPYIDGTGWVAFTVCVWVRVYIVVLDYVTCSCSGTAKLEDAADLFVRAGNSFKVAKRNKGGFYQLEQQLLTKCLLKSRSFLLPPFSHTLSSHLCHQLLVMHSAGQQSSTWVWRPSTRRPPTLWRQDWC